MLKGIPEMIGPELLYALARMGHGDDLAVIDTNFPAYSLGPPVLRLDGHDLPTVLDTVLTLFPLDTFVPPVARMAVVGDKSAVPDAARDAIAVIRQHDDREIEPIPLPRDDFYARAAKAFAIVATGEARPYGCFLLTKGVLPVFTPPAPN